MGRLRVATRCVGRKRMSVARQLQLLAPDFRTLIHRSQFLGEFARGLLEKRLIARLDEARDRFFSFQWRLALCTGDAITVDFRDKLLANCDRQRLVSHRMHLVWVAQSRVQNESQRPTTRQHRTVASL